MTNAFPKTTPQWAVAILFGICVFFLGSFVTSVWGMDGRIHEVETWVKVHDKHHEQVMEKLVSIQDEIKRRRP